MTTLITYTLPSGDYTKAEISSAPDVNGTYTILTEINAPTNYYIDLTGKDYTYYKIRYYDGVNLVWSDYDDPTTFPYNFICDPSDIKEYMDTVGKFTDKELFQHINEQEQELLDEVGTPLCATLSDVTNDDHGDIGMMFYVGEENIQSVEQVFYGTTYPAEIFETEQFRTNYKYGMIRILDVASGGPEMSDQATVEIRYVPKLYHSIVKYRTLKLLYEKTDYTDGDEISVKLQIITARLDAVEKIQNERISVLLSGSKAHYDPVYGMNKNKICQNFERNRMLATRGWNA